MEGMCETYAPALFVRGNRRLKFLVLSSNGLKGVITDLLFCLTDFVVEGTDPPSTSHAMLLSLSHILHIEPYFKDGTLVHHGFLTA